MEKINVNTRLIINIQYLIFLEIITWCSGILGWYIVIMAMAMVRDCFPLGAATCFAVTSTFSSFCSSLDHDRACFLSFLSSKSTLLYSSTHNYVIIQNHVLFTAIKDGRLKSRAYTWKKKNIKLISCMKTLYYISTTVLSLKPLL